jgi:hypothetical protein
VVTVVAVLALLPPLPPRPAETPLATPGRVEALLERAGLVPLTSGEVACALAYPDLDTAVRGSMSAGPMVAAGRRVGNDAVRRAVVESLGPFRTGADGYRQANTLRYVIASA